MALFKLYHDFLYNTLILPFIVKLVFKNARTTFTHSAHVSVPVSAGIVWDATPHRFSTRSARGVCVCV